MDDLSANNSTIVSSSNNDKSLSAISTIVSNNKNNNNNNNNNNMHDGPSTTTNCALSQGSGKPFEFTCLDSPISKSQVQGMTKKASRSWGNSLNILSSTLLWQSRPASYLPLSSSHSVLTVAPILLFLQLLILQRDKSKKITDPEGGSQEEYNTSLNRGDV
jgi:hypothetical protein